MEMIIDIVAELHCLLRTRLPEPWYFVKLKEYKEISCALNNVTYFIVYFTFISWFVKIFIARTQSACGRKLETKDKWLAAVLSIVSAMHLLWPFLLFITYFFTCGFYPWATAIIVILLHLCFLPKAIKALCYSVISHSSNYDDFAPSSTPVIQPRLYVAEPSDYIPSGTPVLQPREREEEYFESTPDSPSMQPQLTSDVQYRTTETFRDEPWPSTEKLRSPSGDESITILPQLDSTSYLIITESETTKPSLDQIITYEEFEPFQKSEDSLAELTAEVMNYTHNFSHIDDFAKDTSSHFKLLVLNAFAKFKNKLKQQNIGFADSQTVTSDQYKRDFSKQANLLRRKVKASSFRKRSVKDSRKTYSRWTNGLYALAMSKPGEKMGYCGRCWRANYLPFKSGFSTLRQPYITRAGTPYGPPKYLMPLCQYVAEYESSMQSCV